MRQNLQENIHRIKDLMNIKESQLLQAPLSGEIHVNSKFHAPRKNGPHVGVDLAAKTGTEVKSPLSGKIVVADMNYNSACGGTIDIEHPDGLKSRFCHISKLLVKKGDIVNQGTVVGLSGGNSNDPGHGNSSGAHLHWSLMKNGQGVNPMDYLNKSVSSGTFGTPTSSMFNLFGTSSADSSGLLNNLFGDSSYYKGFIEKLLKFIFPFIKEDYSSFGKDISIHSKDIIIPSNKNEKIKSPVSGVIENPLYHFGCKNQISIKHMIDGKVFYLEYCGIEKVTVSSGEYVNVGTVLGTTDSDVEVYFYNESGKKQYVDDMMSKESSKIKKEKGSKDRGPIDLPTKDRGPITLPTKDRGPIDLPTKDRVPIDLPTKDRGPI